MRYDRTCCARSLFGLCLGIWLVAGVTTRAQDEPLPGRFEIEIGGYFVTKIDTVAQFARKVGPIEAGTFTPPFGFNIFVAQAVFKTPLSSLYPGLLPFIALAITALMLITYIPALSLWILRFVLGVF